MPTTGSGTPAATHTGPPEIAGYSFSATPVQQDGRTLTFEGRELASHRPVRVRVARSAADLASVQRLRREQSLLRSLAHPNIVGVCPVPPATDALVQEYVSGPSLAERMADPTLGPLGREQVCRMAGDIAAALDFAQEQGVTHGDVQPAHILLPPQESARLIGYGSELPDEADARTDVYGLAATVYFALTGTPPAYEFAPAREEGGGAWRYTLTSASPFRPPALMRPDGEPATAASLDPYLISPRARRPDLPPAAAAVIAHGLAVRPQDRFASAGAFAAALQEAWPVEAALPAVASLPPARRGSALLPLAACAGGAGLLGLGVCLGLAARPPAAPALVSVSKTSPSPRQTLPPPHLARTLPPETPDLAAPGLVLPHAPAMETGPAESPLAARLRPPFKPARHAPSAVKRKATRRAPRPVSAPAAALAESPEEALTPLPAASPETAWLRVTARQAVNASATRPFVANVHAERVSVDGNPSVALSEGDWVRVPPGRHRISFYPPTGGPFSPNNNLHVNLTPGSRSHIQVPLPRRVADDTLIGGRAHFGAASGIIKPTPPGGQARGDDTDDNTSPTSKRAPAERGDF